ncbi:MAG TPA: hypothetical protein VEL07_02035 [Planctomycetota bacterium]|nr:hypothetical protein [Planctomycetota bacterium]
MRAAVTSTLLVSLVLGGCGGSPEPRATAAPGTPPTPGSYVEKGAFAPYYAEELHDGRIYVFGQQKTHEAFVATRSVNPLTSKSFIRRGPNRETVIVESDKDAPTMTTRLWRHFRARHGISA